MRNQKERLQKVCVIGATPAGIAATNKLGEMGIQVTLIDSDPDLNEKLSADKWRLPSGVTLNYANRPGLLRILRNPRIGCILPASISAIKHTPQGFSIRYKRTASYVDAERCTLCGRCAEVCPAEGPDGKKAVRFGGRYSLPGRPFIDKRRTPLCQETCPLGVNVQGYMALARAGKFHEALELIRRDNILPGICGRICTHPCEAACRRNELDQPVAIRDIKRFIADNAGPPEVAALPASKIREKVAVVGSGPAGLAAAADLARMGYRVTIFEKEKMPGGLLRYGIGPYRLPREVLDQEIDYVRAMGIEFRLQTEFEPTGDLAEFSAVVLSTGLWNDRRLNAPGENMEGIQGCIEFLSNVYRGEIGSVSGKVAVIGDGNSAFEAARTLVRLGAEATIVSWFPQDLIPADKSEVEDALSEGVKLITSMKVIEFQGTERLSSIRLVPTEPGLPDSRGICWPVPVKEAKPVEIEFDRAIVAIGQIGVPNAPAGTSTQTEDCTPSSRTGSSNVRVFLAGDAVNGPATVVSAMASGRESALALHDFLSGATHARPVSKRPSDRDFRPITPDIPSRPRALMPEREPGACRGIAVEVALGFNEEQARREASRCLQCGSCSECLQCSEVCSAISHNEMEQEQLEHAGVVIIADPAAAPGIKGEDILRAYSSKALRTDVYAMTLRGFASAAEALLLLGESMPRMKGHGISFSPPGPRLSPDLKIGVFVCRCNDSLGWVPEMDRIVYSLPGTSHVEYAETIDSACSPEGSASILRTIREKGLTRFVLASCVCCPLNLICSACTDQRARLKDTLFHGTGISRAMVETCNLRGEVLAVTPNNPELAVERFRGLIQRSVKRAALLKSLPAPERQYNFTTAVVGQSEAALRSAQVLGGMGMEVFLFGGPGDPLSEPTENFGVHGFLGSSARSLKGTVGDFKLTVDMGDGVQQTFRAGAVILDENASRTIAYMPHPDLPPHDFLQRLQERGVKGVPFFLPGSTSIPGLLLASPQGINLSERIKGTAAAILAASVMPRGPRQNKGYTVSIDRALCRGCGRCVNACPYRAVNFHKNSLGSGYASVDEALCKGCGNCISICPSNAADSPYRDQIFLEQLIEEVLA